MSKQEDYSDVFGEESEEEQEAAINGEEEYEEEDDEGDEEYEEEDVGPPAQEDPAQYKERLDAAKQHLRKKYP